MADCTISEQAEFSPVQTGLILLLKEAGVCLETSAPVCVCVCRSMWSNSVFKPLMHSQYGHTDAFRRSKASSSPSLLRVVVVYKSCTFQPLFK